jgi:hypothetical protein
VTARTSARRAPIAIVLLVLQAFAGGAVTLAHASERFSAPAHIEGRHDAACLALHDELRCALCHYAGSQVHPVPARTFAAPAPRRAPPAAAAARAPAVRARRRAAPPRAPPASRV